MKYQTGVPRGKCHSKTETKTTVSLYLNKKLVERARRRALNLSRTTENALSSILDYMDNQNIETSSEVLNSCSFQENSVDWAGLIPKRVQVQTSTNSIEREIAIASLKM